MGLKRATWAVYTYKGRGGEGVIGVTTTCHGAA